jgi:hypothetical protein
MRFHILAFLSGLPLRTPAGQEKLGRQIGFMLYANGRTIAAVEPGLPVRSTCISPGEALQTVTRNGGSKTDMRTEDFFEAHARTVPGRDVLPRVRADRQVGPTRFMESLLSTFACIGTMNHVTGVVM